MPLRKRPDLVLESVNRLLRGNSVETLARQLGLDPIVGQLELSFSTFDLKSQKLKPMGHVHNPGTIRVFSRLSVTPSCSRIFAARAKTCSASARVRQVTTQ